MAKKKRTVDERIDAIAESVELIAGMQETTEKELRDFRKEVQVFMAGVKEFGKYTQLIVRSHEKRISALERNR